MLQWLQLQLEAYQSVSVQLVPGGMPSRDSQCTLLDELPRGERRLVPAFKLVFVPSCAERLACWSVGCCCNTSCDTPCSLVVVHAGALSLTCLCGRGAASTWACRLSRAANKTKTVMMRFIRCLWSSTPGSGNSHCDHEHHFGFLLLTGR